jgi:hypothetical protein
VSVYPTTVKMYNATSSLHSAFCKQ